MVPGGLELYTKSTNNSIDLGSESNIFKNDIKEELLEVKVGKLEKKIADLEKEVNMQKKKIDLFIKNTMIQNFIQIYMTMMPYKMIV